MATRYASRRVLSYVTLMQGQTKATLLLQQSLKLPQLSGACMVRNDGEQPRGYIVCPLLVIYERLRS